MIDSTRARTELGWKPQVALEEGLSEVVAWVDAYWDEIVTQPLTYEYRA